MKQDASGMLHHTTNGNAVATPEVPAQLTRPRSHKNMRVTLNLPMALLDRMRNTVYWTPGITLTGLIKGAIQDSLDRMEQRQGHPFPVRLSELKCGRPRKRASASSSNGGYDTSRVMRLPERPLASNFASSQFK